MTQSIDRRSFVARAAGMAALPASSLHRILGASDRVRLGVIGLGSRGRYVMSLFQRQPRVEVVALCDVFPDAVRQGATAAPGARAFTDHRALLDMRDVDAVLIATPDHWHAPMTIAALDAGRDVYLEKPLTEEMEPADQLLAAARRSDRVVQVGLQQRSGAHYRRAREEFFQSGRIGRVAQVRTYWYGYGGPALPAAPQPAGLDWQAWLGPAPARPFDMDRFRNWRWYWDYAGGSITDLFTHWIDVVHWFTGADRPAAVSALGGRWVYPSAREIPDTVSLALEYPGGHSVSFECTAAPGARGWGIEFLGTGGRLYIDRSRYTWTGIERDAKPQTVEEPEDATIAHVRDFLAAMRERRRPSSDIESAYLSTRAALLARQSYRQQRRIDP